MGVLAETLTSLVAGLLAYEMSARVPKLSRWLIEVSVRQLPPEQQDRYREEWLAHYHDMPNSMARLSHALTLVMTGAAREIAGGLAEQKLATIGAGLSELTRDATRHRVQIRKIDEQLFDLEREDKLGKVAKNALSEIDGILMSSGLSADIVDPMRNSVKEHVAAIQHASNRSRELLKLRAVSLRQTTEGVADQLALATAAYERAKRTRKSMRKARFDDALTEVLVHLQEAHNIQMSGHDYEALVEESDRISNALKKVVKLDLTALTHIQIPPS